MEISGKSFHFNLRLDDMTSQIWTKLLGTGYRVLSYIRNLPVRLNRIVQHLWKGLLFLRPNRLQWWGSAQNSILVHRIGMWWLELLLYVLDGFGIPEMV